MRYANYGRMEVSKLWDTKLAENKFAVTSTHVLGELMLERLVLPKTLDMFTWNWYSTATKAFCNELSRCLVKLMFGSFQIFLYFHLEIFLQRSLENFMFWTLVTLLQRTLVTFRWFKIPLKILDTFRNESNEVESGKGECPHACKEIISSGRGSAAERKPNVDQQCDQYFVY